MCSCLYLLSATGGTVPSNGGDDQKQGGGTTRFLRRGAAAAAAATVVAAEDTFSDLNDDEEENSSLLHGDSRSSAVLMTESLSPDGSADKNDEDGRQKKFLRRGTSTALATNAMDADTTTLDVSASTASMGAGDDSSTSSSSANGSDVSSTTAAVIELEEEEFDYETYHRSHYIPLPMLGAMAADASILDAPATITAARVDEDDDSLYSTNDSDSSSSSSIAAVTEPSLMEEEYDYETYRVRHNIPIPALGATMMGMMNTANLAAKNTEPAGSPSPLQRDNRGWGADDDDVDDSSFVHQHRGGILAFAGTSEAMASFATVTDDDDDDTAEHGAYSDETEEEPSPFGNKNVLAFAGTSAAMTKIATEMDEQHDHEKLLYEASLAHLHYQTLLAKVEEMENGETSSTSDGSDHENLLYEASLAHLHYQGLLAKIEELEESEELSSMSDGSDHENLLYEASLAHLHYQGLLAKVEEMEDGKEPSLTLGEQPLSDSSDHENVPATSTNLLYQAALAHVHYQKLLTPTDEMEGEPPLPNDNNDSLAYESTLAAITKSHSSLLWGSDGDDNSSPEDPTRTTSKDPIIDAAAPLKKPEIQPTNKTEGGAPEPTYDAAAAVLKKRKAHKNLSNPTSLCQFSLPCSSDDSELCQFWLPCSASERRAGSDLDRGRHLVGLEVREVRPHQQIIVDYEQDVVATSEEELEYLNYEDMSEGRTTRPLRIKFLLSENTESQAGVNKNSEAESALLSALLETSFNRTANFWSQALSLQPVVDNIVPTVETCGSARIPSLHRTNGVGEADVLVYVSGDNKFCGGALMHAAVCDYDQNMRPLVANINICTRNLPTETSQKHGTRMVSPSTARDYDGYIATETARVLGASASLFRHYQNPDTETPYGSTEKRADCVDGTQETIEVPTVIGENIDQLTGRVYYEIRTPKVTEVVRNHFDCMTMTGARLDVKKGGISCFGGFLDDRLFFGEQTSGFQVITAKGKGLSISPLTLALLEDSSWYTPNYAMSTDMSFGRGAGCQFAHGGCTLDEEGAVRASTQNEGFHCADIGATGCDVSHSSKARCDLLHPTTVASQHDLFGGSSARNEVCPMYIRGAIDCADAGTKPPSSSLPGEVYGESSKCFQTEEGEPMCLKGSCNEKTQGVDVHYDGQVFSCLHHGQIIDTHKGVRIECPRVAAICPNLICPSNCSGRGVCDEDRDGKHACICDDPFDETPGCWNS